MLLDRFVADDVFEELVLYLFGRGLVLQSIFNDRY